MTIKIFSGPAPISGDLSPMGHEARTRCRTAAHRARRLYPGPLGELVARELTAYADFGYNLAADALVPRLAADILDRADALPQPPPR